MNNIITVYNTDNGEIWGTLSCPEAANDLQCPENHDWVLGEHDGRLYYYNGADTVQRPLIIPAQSKQDIQADGVDTSMISGIPTGAEITSKDTTITADGSNIEFVTDIPGEHKLSITLWPYQDAEVIINAI